MGAAQTQDMWLGHRRKEGDEKALDLKKVKRELTTGINTLKVGGKIRKNVCVCVGGSEESTIL